MANMDASIFLLLLIALVALAGVWLLNRPFTRKESDRLHESRMESNRLHESHVVSNRFGESRIDSFGIPGAAANGAQEVGASSDCPSSSTPGN